MRLRTLFTALLFAAVFTVSAAAHHSINAEFDSTKQVSLAGTVTNVDWMNPHTYVFVDVKDPEIGKTRTWACELANDIRPCLGLTCRSSGETSSLVS